MRPVILILDDEELVTKTLATYLELETDYEIRPFQSPAEALEDLKAKPCDVVISDFYMPEMDGLHFLIEVKRLCPRSTRILLTGYADKENAIKAINEVGLFQYIEKPWDNDQVRLIIRNALANQNLKTILENKIRELDDALLARDKIAEEHELLQEELSLARHVQESMLPQEYPFMNGISMTAKYMPALAIGGDFYDVIPLADNHVAVLLADVTGHGIKAALITALLKSAFTSFKESKVTPSTILSDMNAILHKVLPKNLFVAALVVRIDLTTGTCRIGNAGIPYPYFLPGQRKRAEKLHANGLLLGIADEALYSPGEEVSLVLQAGDRLILFTDGLSEAEDQSNAHFDSVHLKQTLVNSSAKAGEKILEEIAQAARSFSRPEHKWDDVTILSIEAK